MFWKRKFVTCSHCGNKVKADHSFCMNCHRSLLSGPRSDRMIHTTRTTATTTMNKQQEKPDKELPDRLKLIMTVMTPAGWILLFFFPPVGILFLALSFGLKRYLKKTISRPCPYCNRDTVAFLGTKPGTEFICLYCKKKIRIGQSEGEPVFIQA